MQSHELTSHPSEFNALSEDSSTFKIKLKNENFRRGDTVTFSEFNGTLTGRQKSYYVKFIIPLDLFSFIKSQYVLLYLSPE